MPGRWILVAILLLVAVAIGIAMIVAMIRDVDADKRDLGGKTARRDRIDLFGKRSRTPEDAERDKRTK